MNIIIINIYHCRIPLAFLKQWGLRNYKSTLLGLMQGDGGVGGLGLIVSITLINLLLPKRPTYTMHEKLHSVCWPIRAPHKTRKTVTNTTLRSSKYDAVAD